MSEIFEPKPEIIPYSESNPWYLQAPENLPAEFIGLTADEMEEAIGDLAIMGYLHEATSLLSLPEEPGEPTLPKRSKEII